MIEVHPPGDDVDAAVGEVQSLGDALEVARDPYAVLEFGDELVLIGLAHERLAVRTEAVLFDYVPDSLHDGSAAVVERRRHPVLGGIELDRKVARLPCPDCGAAGEVDVLVSRRNSRRTLRKDRNSEKPNSRQQSGDGSASDRHACLLAPRALGYW